MTTFVSDHGLRRALLVAALVAAVLVALNQVQQMTARQVRAQVQADYRIAATATTTAYWQEWNASARVEGTTRAQHLASADATDTVRLATSEAWQASDPKGWLLGVPSTPTPGPAGR